MTDSETLAAYSCMYHGDWSRIAEALAQRRAPLPCTIPTGYITVLDEDYPERLKALRYPPWVLFYQGNLSLLKRQSITVIGSRSLSEYGRKMTHEIVRRLAGRYVIVSGLAKGADGEAHRSAIEAGGSTIGVTGSGLKTHYPKENEQLYRIMAQKHLILSEYPYDTGVRKEHFPWRNRILAALSERIVVSQAALKSGTMLTVNEGLALNREIWCVPYPYGSEEGGGCSLLIQQGANMLYDPAQLDDFLH